MATEARDDTRERLAGVVRGAAFDYGRPRVCAVRRSGRTDVAGLGIEIAAPLSVNGSNNLAPQTTILRNVRFEYPANRRDAHIAITPDGGATTNLNLRNDVRILDYDAAPGQDGPDLYLVPAYQPAARCDDAIGVCASDLTAGHPHIQGAAVHPLR